MHAIPLVRHTALMSTILLLGSCAADHPPLHAQNDLTQRVQKEWHLSNFETDRDTITQFISMPAARETLSGAGTTTFLPEALQRLAITRHQLRDVCESGGGTLSAIDRSGLRAGAAPHAAGEALGAAPEPATAWLSRNSFETEKATPAESRAASPGVDASISNAIKTARQAQWLGRFACFGGQQKWVAQIRFDAASMHEDGGPHNDMPYAEMRLKVIIRGQG